jgi:succinyl-CoA synthetase alpha subunit
MKQQGAPIVAGIGSRGILIEDIPIYDLVEQAIRAEGELDLSLIFVNSYQVLDAALEAMINGIKQIIIFSAGVPPLDMFKLLKTAKTLGVVILGPGSQGLLIPDRLHLGLHQIQYYKAGSLGIVSRVDRLINEIARILSKHEIGQSLCVCLGRDRILASPFEKWLDILAKDDQTETILLLGRAYEPEEIKAIEYLEREVQKPAIVYLAGLESPIDRTIWTQFSSYLLNSVPPDNTQNLWLEQLTNLKTPIIQSIQDIPQAIREL